VTASRASIVSNAKRIGGLALRVRPGIDLGAWGPILFFGCLILAFGVTEPSVFLTTGNLTSILNDGAVLAILACGLTVVLIAGEFDLSFAAAASFGGALAAVLIAHQHWPWPAVVAVVLASGIGIGIVNGVLVMYFGVSALIATIGVSSILDGLTLWITNNSVIFTGFTSPFLKLGDWSIGEVQAPVIYLAVLVLALAVALRYTATGRHLYATGGNRDASRMSGIRVEQQVILAFVISALLGTLGGMVYTARQGSLTPQFGTGFLLPAYAAAFIGAVTLTRSTFHIVGTVIGVYLIETGTTGLLIVGGPAFTQQLFSGAVLILATIGARYRGRSGTLGRGSWLRLRRRRGEPLPAEPEPSSRTAKEVTS
jgi:ribose transport system permease protein